jgi:Tfp pilus assembly protein PilF
MAAVEVATNPPSSTSNSAFYSLRLKNKTPIIFAINRRIMNIRSYVLLSFVLLSSSLPLQAGQKMPEEIKQQLAFGVRAAKNDHWDEAIYRWQKVLQLDHDNVMAHNNLAVAYEQLGEYDLAMEEYEIAYRLDGQSEVIKNNIDRFRDFYRKYQRQKK